MRRYNYRAWELINSARGSTGDGGRIDALEDLNNDGVSLAAAPLKKAWLQEVDLQGASLLKADLQEAYLERANLMEANLGGAEFGGANLQRASFTGTNLRGANLWETEGLTQEQLDSALGDNATQLPEHLTRPAHWASSKSEEPAE